MKSLKWRSFVIFISIFLGALSVTFAIIYQVVSKDLKRLAVESASYEIDAAVKNLDNQLESMKKTYYTADFSKRLISELCKPGDQIDYQMILSTLEELIYFSDHIHSIYLMDTKNHVFLSTETMAWYDSDDGWFLRYRTGDEKELKLVHTLDVTSSYNQMISYVGDMKVDFFGDTVAWLSVNMLRHDVSQMIMKDTLYQDSIQLITDGSGRAMAQSSNFDQSVADALTGHEKNRSFIPLNGQEYLYLEGTTANGCRYIKLIPQDEMFAGINKVGMILMASFVFFGILILFATYKLLDYLTKPIYELSAKIRSYRQEDSVRVVFKTDRTDEFAYLFKSLEDMTDHIDHLIDELYKSDLYKKEMQLKLYRISINPHFVFNLLDSVTWTMKFKDYEKAETTLSNFADFFRASLSQNQDYVTVEDTRRWLTSYCYLASFLKDDQISLQMDIDQSLSDIRIPSLLVQPVIENSFKYAFEGNRPGRILVRVEKLEDRLCFTIRDDGVGMTEEEALEIMDHMKAYDIHKSTRHFGLASVYQRLKLMYGTDVNFKLSSDIHSGTEVYFEIKV